MRLLGRVQASWRGATVQPKGSAAVALLAILALRRGPCTRDLLAAALFPDGGPKSFAWLRQALWQLKRAFGADADAVLDANPESVAIRPDVDLDVDATAFEAILRSRPPRPEDAVALYRGDLASGIDLECFARERERLADLYEDALADLGARCLRSGDLDCARDAALNLLERDPLREEGHATLIEVYGRTGSRSQVSRQYRRLQRLLADELGVDPLPETEISYRTALTRSTARSAARAVMVLRDGAGFDMATYTRREEPRLGEGSDGHPD